MILNKLTLISFGKFQNKEITFDQGFNILEGENEVGKTTIHKFIEGMLFGFLDPTKSRRVYKEDHTKYQPKNASDYRGSMTISMDKKTYRIERNFDKKQADVKVFDDQNGTNITEKLSVHPSLKLPDIADFIGISYKLYLNTISISQILRKTEKDLGQALVEKLHNITTTKDESISIANIKQDLEKSLSEIGSEKAKTKPYAKAIEQVRNLDKQMEESKQKYQESERLFQEKKHKEQESKEVQAKLNDVKNKINQYHNTKKKDQYKKAIRLKELMDKHTLHIETNKDALDLSEDNYERLQQIRNELKYTRQTIRDKEESLQAKEKSKSVQEKILDQHPGFSAYQESIYSFRELYYAYKNLEEEVLDKKQELEYLKQQEEDIQINEELIEDHDTLEKLKEKQNQFNLSSLEQTLFLAKQERKQTQENKPSKFLLFLYYGLMLFIVGFFLANKQKQKIQAHDALLNEQKSEIMSIEAEIEKQRKQDQQISGQMHAIYQKHGIDQAHNFAEERRKEERKKQSKETYKKQLSDVSKTLEKRKKEHQEAQEELSKHCAILQIKQPKNKQELEDVEQAFLKHQSAKNTLQTLNKEIQEQKNEADLLSKKERKLTKEYQEILEKDKQSSIEEYKEGLRRKADVLQVQKENTQLHERMQDLTEGNTLEDFKKDIDFDALDYKGKESIHELEQEQTNLRQEIRTIQADSYELEKEIALIEKTYKDVYTLQALKTKAEHERSKLKNEKEAIELASSVIDDLAKEIQYEFAPTLNEAISGVMNQITSGKYEDLKIDQETNIKMVDNYLQQLLSTEDFSTGTIDQIYFSMRLGLSKILFDQSFPYILDDTFVNYDATRLRRVLSLLEKEDNQILLFTCHKREHNLAKEEDIKHHYQKLT